MSLADFWYEKLLKPQGFFRPSVEVDPLGNTFGAGGLMVTTGHPLAMGRSLLTRDGLVPDSWIEYIQQPGCADTWQQVDGTYHYGSGFWLHENGCYMADGKFGQFSVVMADKGAVLAMTSDCETPHETLQWSPCCLLALKQLMGQKRCRTEETCAPHPPKTFA